MSHTFKIGVLAATVMALAPAAQAFEAGNFILRAGASYSAPDASSEQIKVGGAAFPTANSRIDANANTQLGIRDAKLGETKHLPPTLTLQYYPVHSSSGWPCFYTIPFFIFRV
jgi:outer membrane protein